MIHQIIKQPNGKYALYSSIVDDFVLLDADPQDIINEWVEKYKTDMENKVSEIIAALEKGEKPYCQFTMSFEEAMKNIKHRHGKKAESLVWIADNIKK